MPPSIDVPMPPCIDGDTITFELRGIEVVNTGPTVSFRGTLSLERGTHVTEAEAAPVIDSFIETLREGAKETFRLEPPVPYQSPLVHDNRQPLKGSSCQN